MLVSLRCRPSFLRFIHPRRSSLQCLGARSISLPPTREDEEDDDDEGEDVTKLQRRQVSARPEDWLDGEGLRYKEPKLGPNWLGGDVPFPMNPSFSPPLPVTNAIKTKMHLEHLFDPQRNNIRALSAKYGISIKRVDAIIRLKQLEDQWKEKRPLQTGFQEGMMRMMIGRSSRHLANITEQNATAADLQADEGQDKARDRYQRSFWEPVAEGDEPIVQRTIEKAKDDSASARLLAKQAKLDPILMYGTAVPRKDKRTVPKESIFESSGEKRPPTKFVDVGGKFLNVADRTRRLHEATRRKSMRRKSSSRS